MTNTKAIIILFRAFFLSQCKFFKKNEFIYTTVYGVSAALIIGIKNGAFGPIIGSLCFLILELLLQGLTVYWKFFLGFFIIFITMNNHNSILGIFNKKL